MSPSPERLDTVYQIATPEGVALQLRLAGPMVRVMAWAIDCGIRFAVYIVLVLIFALVSLWVRSGAVMAALFILLFVLEWFYPVLFEMFARGQTPGKMLFRLQVLHDDGTPVSWAASLQRNFLRVVDFLPFFNALGLLSMLFSQRFQRLGDWVAGTVVVYLPVSAHWQAVQDVTPQAPMIPLSLEEQRAILAFAERSAGLTLERRQELALLLAEPLATEQPQQAVLTLRAWAAWLNGQHHVQSSAAEVR